MSLIQLIQEQLEPDVDSLSRIDGLPALRVTHAGAESLVLVLPAKGAMKRLLELLDVLEVPRAKPAPSACRGSRREMVTVCDACGCEACWRGEFMCENARTAGTKQVHRG